MQQVSFDTREAWLAGRRAGIGGSDAPVILGYAKWQTPHQVWLSKVGGDAGVKASEQMEWGNRLEAAILQWFGDKGHKLEPRTAPYTITIHRNNEWMRASFDGICKGCSLHSEPAIVQVKNVSQWAAKEWEGGPPRHVLAQVQHEMEVADYDLAFVVALFGGCHAEVFKVTRHSRLVEAIHSVESRFWERVTTNTPPPLKDGLDVAIALRNVDLDNAAIVPVETALVWRQRMLLIEEKLKELKQYEDEYDDIKDEMKRYAAERNAGKLVAGTMKWIVKKIERAGYSVPTSSYATLKYAGDDVAKKGKKKP